jgi:DNA polymerase IV
MSRSQVRRQKTPLHFGDDDSGSPILHVDMDAFYASVELRSRPELIGRPVIVGAGGGRSVVLSATYEARALGVHSAMPMARAVRLVPNAVVLPPDMHTYGEVSRAIMKTFESVTPMVEPISLDEAFLDVAGARRLLGSPAHIGKIIRARVAQEHGITCSVGVAPNKFVAKLASTACKPDALLVIPPDRVLAFLHPLPVNALWGVGERTEETLLRLGLRTVGDIAHTPLNTLQRALGNAVGAHLAELSWGRDARPVQRREVEKSIGAEHTFASDIDDEQVITSQLSQLSDGVGRRLRAAELVATVIQMKLRFADFRTVTRSRTLTSPTDVGQVIFEHERALYAALGLERVRIRLVGVRVSGLKPAQGSASQLAFDEPQYRDAEVAIDRLRARFGADVVGPARVVHKNRPPAGVEKEESGISLSKTQNDQVG